MCGSEGKREADEKSYDHFHSNNSNIYLFLRQSGVGLKGLVPVQKKIVNRNKISLELHSLVTIDARA